HSAEFGIAANFRDPHAAARLAEPARAEQLAWLRRVLDWQQEVDDAAKFIDALRCEFTEQQVHVFTEAGRAVVLPAGATPVAPAYTVDATLGNACIGAPVTGRLVPLSSTLDEGDVVEIITRGSSGRLDRGPGPAREWLDFVRSPQARVEITKWFSTRTESVATVEQRVRLGRPAARPGAPRAGPPPRGETPPPALAR